MHCNVFATNWNTHNTLFWCVFDWIIKIHFLVQTYQAIKKYGCAVFYRGEGLLLSLGLF